MCLLPIVLALLLHREVRGLSKPAWESVLRADLLNSTDSMVPPTGEGGDRDPVIVTVGMNVYKIKDIQIGQSTMDVSAWLRLSWVDPRLAWDPADYGGVNQTVFYSEPVENEAEIWMPDLEFYNQVTSLYDASRKGVQVWSDGTAFVSRPAIYQLLCSFVDIETFPYDNPCCTVDMGGWASSGLYVYYVAGALEFSVTNGVNDEFVEFLTLPEKSEVSSDVSYYPCCPEEPWPIISFKICSKRSRAPYIRTMIVPNILITTLAFVTLWIDPQSGERLAYSATLLLALIAVEFITVDWIPKTERMLWVEILAISSLAFTVATAISGILAAYFGTKWNRDCERLAKQDEIDADKKKGHSNTMKGNIHELETKVRRTSITRNSPSQMSSFSQKSTPKSSMKGNALSTVKEDNSELLTLSLEEDGLTVDLERPNLDEGGGEDDEDDPLPRSPEARSPSMSQRMALEGELELRTMRGGHMPMRHSVGGVNDEEEPELALVKPVIVFGRYYLHWGKAVDVYSRLVLPAGYFALLAWLFARIIE